MMQAWDEARARIAARLVDDPRRAAYEALGCPIPAPLPAPVVHGGGERVSLDAATWLGRGGSRRLATECARIAAVQSRGWCIGAVTHAEALVGARALLAGAGRAPTTAG